MCHGLKVLYKNLRLWRTHTIWKRYLTVSSKYNNLSYTLNHEQTTSKMRARLGELQYSTWRRISIAKIVQQIYLFYDKITLHLRHQKLIYFRIFSSRAYIQKRGWSWAQACWWNQNSWVNISKTHRRNPQYRRYYSNKSRQ